MLDRKIPPPRQLVDWRAVFWSGILSGILFLLVNLLLGYIYLGSPWLFLREEAAMVLGKGVIPPTADNDALVFVVALATNLVLSLIFTAIVATIIHRWGLLVGVFGGALIGLALYAINFYTISYFFPWFFSLRSWMVLLAHVIFGAAAGGFYEAFETERYAPAAPPDQIVGSR